MSFERQMITIQDMAKSISKRTGQTMRTQGDFSWHGLPFLCGCQVCGAQLGPWNACPSKTGYVRCGNCLGDMGFSTVIEAFNHGED